MGKAGRRGNMTWLYGLCDELVEGVESVCATKSVTSQRARKPSNPFTGRVMEKSVIVDIMLSPLRGSTDMIWTWG